MNDLEIDKGDFCFSVVVAVGRHDSEGKIIESDGNLSWGVLEMTEDEAYTIYKEVAEHFSGIWKEKWAKEKTD